MINRGTAGRSKRPQWRVVNGRLVPVVLEEDVVEEIRLRLWYSGIRVYRIRERIPGAGGRPSEAGVPDLIGYIPPSYPSNHSPSPYGVPLFIEVKRPGKSHKRKAQLDFISEAQSGGCIAGFCDSWESTRALFQLHGFELPA